MIGRPRVTLTALAEARVLQHRQPLVVIHGQHRVHAAAGCSRVKAVSAGSGPVTCRPAARSAVDGRLDDVVDLLRAEVARLAGVGIEAEHDDARCRDAEAPLQAVVRGSGQSLPRRWRVMAAGDVLAAAGGW